MRITGLGGSAGGTAMHTGFHVRALLGCLVPRSLVESTLQYHVHRQTSLSSIRQLLPAFGEAQSRVCGV